MKIKVELNNDQVRTVTQAGAMMGYEFDTALQILVDEEIERFEQILQRFEDGE